MFEARIDVGPRERVERARTARAWPRRPRRSPRRRSRRRRARRARSRSSDAPSAASRSAARQLALLDELAEALLDRRCARDRAPAAATSTQPHVEARLREHLGDAVAHRARADDADCAGSSISHALASVVDGVAQTRSTASATPLPPPRHSAAMPRFSVAGASARRAASSARARRSRRSGGRARRRRRGRSRVAGSMPELAHDRDRLHRERLVQLEEVDVVERPADLLQRRLRTASTGVISTNFGARPLVACADDARQRRRGRAPRAASAAITTSAAAPSLTPGALPAVTVPSFLNAGFSVAERLGGRVRRGSARRDRRRSASPFFCGIAIGRISSLNAPVAVARARPC